MKERPVSLSLMRLEQMGGRRSVTKEDERFERSGCKGAEIRGLRKLECIVSLGEINDFVFYTH
jgi:hypothetical protein